MDISTQSSCIQVIDSHTAGEPTRVIVSGAPDLGSGSMAERLQRFRAAHDSFRRAVLCEPRGSEVLVGALLLKPASATAAAGVIFFNNAGYLGMCGHGMIGLAATLAYMKRINPGEHRIETPVGDVTVQLESNHSVTVANVEAYRLHKAAALEVPGYGTVRGDVAWGGNWFFLVQDHPFQLTLAHEEELMAFTWAIRKALPAAGITGSNGAEIDHIELFAAPHNSANDSRNFVLCPGKEYDRSPCGTGTSAKMACLAADGKLNPDEPWRQEGILGSVFTGHYEASGDRIRPFISGSAYVTAESSLIFDSNDPFREGIPAAEHSQA
ncbi:MAG: proline racemase family protein [Acidobacteriota bacterium]|nr:proline racemase family protein [Acidobacteriota bacterium]